MFTRDTIHEYLEKYNLGSVRFTKLAGVGIGSLYKYMNGQSLSRKTEARIRCGLTILEKHNLVAPEYKAEYPNDYIAWNNKRIKYEKDSQKYSEEFKRLLKEELEKETPVGYILTDQAKPCCVCGHMTNRLQYSYENYICSEKCEKVMSDMVYKIERDAVVY